MKKKFSNILEDIRSYLLTGIVGTGVLIIYGVSRASVFNWKFFILGCLLIAIPVIGYLLFDIILEKQIENAYQKYLRKLKETGERINVNLADCELKKNNWSYSRNRYHDPRIVFLNEVSGHSDKNFEIINANLCVLIYHTNYKGRMRYFRSGTIAKDEATLKMLFELKKTTSIIVDCRNPKYYYFDLEVASKELCK